MRHLTLHIAGMSCGHCLNAVNQALASVPGVQIDSVRIGRAELRFDESITTPARIETAVDNAGYHASSTPSEAGA
ncbi:MAG TPA: cation transporter [Gemmatimonadales bacterium]|jgi:copper chaperone|nr:cation transporter [Gemmatimonadales bacterium]